MKLAVFGLSLSSSWGNGHATTYRALLRAFVARGHEVTFFERDVPWYASQRDLPDPTFCKLVLYDSVAMLDRHEAEILDTDAVLVGSYVPEGVAVIDWLLQHINATIVFYDIDTPITVAALQSGDAVYIARRQVPAFDTYLSFTGGPMLDRLRSDFGAQRAVPLYCSVDTERYRPQDVMHRWDLSYMGTYSADRQPTLERLLIQPARAAPGCRFVVAGSQFPPGIEWPDNVELIDHVPPAEHSLFYSYSRWTLNVTRAEMATAGYSPSVRLFEAAACRTAIISDPWVGLDSVFALGDEIAVASTCGDVLVALGASDDARCTLALAAQNRVSEAHTSDHRAAELEAALRGRVNKR